MYGWRKSPTTLRGQTIVSLLKFLTLMRVSLPASNQLGLLLAYLLHFRVMLYSPFTKGRRSSFNAFLQIIIILSLRSAFETTQFDTVTIATITNVRDNRDNIVETSFEIYVHIRYFGVDLVWFPLLPACLPASSIPESLLYRYPIIIMFGKGQKKLSLRLIINQQFDCIVVLQLNASTTVRCGSCDKAV